MQPQPHQRLHPGEGPASGRPQRDVLTQVPARSLDQETKARRGDLQFFLKNGQGYGERRFPQSPTPIEVAQAAFAIPGVGEVEPQPLQSKMGWHLIQRTGGKRAFKRTLEEVRTEIRNLLFRTRKAQALEDYVSNLKSSVKITIDQKKLDMIKLPSSSRVQSPSARSLPFSIPSPPPQP